MACDDVLNAIERMKHSKAPDWNHIAGLYKYLKEKYGNHLWLSRGLADALYNAGHHLAAYVLACAINKDSENIETLKIQADAERDLGIKKNTMSRVAEMLR